MSITDTMRMPDCGSVNRLLPAADVVGLLIFALSSICLCGIPLTGGIFDGETDLSSLPCLPK